jgi:hypothetical protein
MIAGITAASRSVAERLVMRIASRLLCLRWREAFLKLGRRRVPRVAALFTRQRGLWLNYW